VGHSQLDNNGRGANDFKTTVFANLYKLQLHFARDEESGNFAGSRRTYWLFACQPEATWHAEGLRTNSRIKHY